jgi:6-phosphogluconolactonase
MTRLCRTIGTFVESLVVVLLLCAAAGPQASSEIKPAKETLVYAGTSKGIQLFWLQTKNLEVSQNITPVPLGLAADTPNPSFIELDVKRRRLFCVNGVQTFEGKPTGAVSAFSIDSDTGKLTLLNQRPWMGSGPCHLVIDEHGRNLLVANLRQRECRCTAHWTRWTAGGGHGGSATNREKR